MANQEHLSILTLRGILEWNKWRAEHQGIQPDLSGVNLSGADPSRTWRIFSEADLSGADLSGADLSGSNLSGSNLSGSNLSGSNLSRTRFYRADLSRANLSQTDLSQAFLHDVDLSGADLSGADLSEADLSGADLSATDLSGADLSGADLSRTILIKTNLTRTILKDCVIYGIAVWDVQLEGATQLNLAITPYDQPTITVDNLKIAQFIYLLLNNQEIRDVIDTLARKAVLILGRFTPQRKAVLNAIRDELRKKDYLPILFDFEIPSSRNVTETVRTLAHLSCFIIADLTDPSSIPHELQAIVPTVAIPVQPIIEASKREYSMFPDLSRYHWVLSTYRYTNLVNLLDNLRERVIEPAEEKAQELIRP